MTHLALKLLTHLRRYHVLYSILFVVFLGMIHTVKTQSVFICLPLTSMSFMNEERVTNKMNYYYYYYLWFINVISIIWS